MKIKLNNIIKVASAMAIIAIPVTATYFIVEYTKNKADPVNPKTDPFFKVEKLMVYDSGPEDNILIFSYKNLSFHGNPLGSLDFERVGLQFDYRDDSGTPHRSLVTTGSYDSKTISGVIEFAHSSAWTETDGEYEQKKVIAKFASINTRVDQAFASFGLWQDHFNISAIASLVYFPAATVKNNQNYEYFTNKDKTILTTEISFFHNSSNVQTRKYTEN